MYHSTYMLSTISDLFMATDSAYKVMQFLDTDTSYSVSQEQGIIPNSFDEDVAFRNVQFSYPTNLHTKVGLIIYKLNILKLILHYKNNFNEKFRYSMI